MSNGTPPGGAFGARLLSGLLDGMTQRYQQGQSQQREDQLYQTQLADKQALEDQRFSRDKELIGERQRVKTEADEAAKPSMLDREIEQQAVLDAFEKQMRVKADVEFEYDKRRAEAGVPRRSSGQPKPVTQANLTAEAKKTLPNHDSNAHAKIGEIAFNEKVSVPEAAAMYFAAKGEGREIGGLPGTTPSGESLEGRRSTLVKNLGNTMIEDDYTVSLSKYPDVFGEDGTNETEYTLEVADKMLAIDDMVRTGQMSMGEGMTSRMLGIQTVTARGFIGSPKENYKDSITLNLLSPETRQQIVAHGVTTPLDFNPDQINARASEATGEDLLLFGGGENPDYEDIVMRMVQHGLSGDIIKNAVKGIFEPGSIESITSSSIGERLNTAGQGVLDALGSVGTAARSGGTAGKIFSGR